MTARIARWASQRNAIRAALKAQGLTQVQLAALVGISEKHLSQLLTGHVAGSVVLWDEIAGALGCTWVLSIDPARRR